MIFLTLLLALIQTDLTLQQVKGNYPCGVPAIEPIRKQDNHRIVGGWEAKPHSIPWQVMVKTYATSTSFGLCGGSLIPESSKKNGTSLVLTAAHCMENNGRYPYASKVKVVAGIHDRRDPYDPNNVDLAVLQYAQAGFNPKTNNNDVVLIRLQSTVPYTDKTRPICLPQPNEDLPVSLECYVSGWGTTWESGSTADKLRQVDAVVVEASECPNRINPETMLCAGHIRGGKDSCQGDSGGPLFCKNKNAWTLYGVVSYGVGCARVKQLGVYAKVSNYINWINSQSKALGAGSRTSRVSDNSEQIVAKGSFQEQGEESSDWD